jgi:hypothetical protein
MIAHIFELRSDLLRQLEVLRPRRHACECMHAFMQRVSDYFAPLT